MPFAEYLIIAAKPTEHKTGDTKMDTTKIKSEIEKTIRGVLPPNLVHSSFEESNVLYLFLDLQKKKIDGVHYCARPGNAYLLDKHELVIPVGLHPDRIDYRTAFKELGYIYDETQSEYVVMTKLDGFEFDSAEAARSYIEISASYAYIDSEIDGWINIICERFDELTT